MNLKSLMEALDAVNKKALNKKFDDRSDKDIDNDGDVDKSDEYLHNRRKAVTKAVSKEGHNDDNGNGNGDDEKEVTVNINMNDKKKKKNGNNDNEVEMNPKVDNMKKSESVKKESFREKLLGILEAENHTPNKDKAEKPEDNLKGAGAKQMKKDVEAGAEMRDDDRKGHDDVAKAGRAGPGPKPRPNDSKTGDKNIVNKITDDQTQKGRKDLGAEGFKEELSPIASMEKLTDAFKMVLGKKENINEAMSDAEAHDNAAYGHKKRMIDHEAMAAAHKREAEGTKTSHPEHSQHHANLADEHQQAAYMHQDAHDDLKKHGVNSSQYKSSAGHAHRETSQLNSLVYHHDRGHHDDGSKDAPHLTTSGYSTKMNWHHTKPAVTSHVNYHDN